MTPAEIFHRLLEESATTIAHPGAHALPSDELHTEILLPLLPAMLRDPVIREAWLSPVGRGFFSKMKAARETGGAPPQWVPDDFEIHVTASYLAGPDAKALADTLLSEPGLRDLTAALMNQLLDIVWQILPPVEPVIVEAAPPETLAAVVPELEQPAPVAPQEAPAAAPEVPPLVTPAWQIIAGAAKGVRLRRTGDSAPVFLRNIRSLRGQREGTRHAQNLHKPRLFPSQTRRKAATSARNLWRYHVPFHKLSQNPTSPGRPSTASPSTTGLSSDSVKTPPPQ